MFSDRTAVVEMARKGKTETEREREQCSNIMGQNLSQILAHRLGQYYIQSEVLQS